VDVVLSVMVYLISLLALKITVPHVGVFRKLNVDQSGFPATLCSTGKVFLSETLSSAVSCIVMGTPEKIFSAVAHTGIVIVMVE
jgi:hypothetical protein